jgi:hypothetical protein
MPTQHYLVVDVRFVLRICLVITLQGLASSLCQIRSEPLMIGTLRVN